MSIGYSAVEIRQGNFKVMFASAKKIKQKTFRIRVHCYIKISVLL